MAGDGLHPFFIARAPAVFHPQGAYMLFSPSSVGEVSGNIFAICYLYNVYKITVRSGRKKER
jgi:hypothetical protein